jgi:hypothetical protein
VLERVVAGVRLSLEADSFWLNDNPARTEYGLIAQDVEEVFPGLVSTASVPSARSSAPAVLSCPWQGRRA